MSQNNIPAPFGALPPPPHPETREEEADRALRSTSFSCGAASALCGLFLLSIVSVPVVQLVVERQRNLSDRQEAQAQGTPLPQSWDTVRAAFARIPTASEIRAYETTLEEQSALTEWSLPPVQYALTGFLGAGNEQAYIGRDGWLMYRPDVEYLTGRGFLDPAHLRVVPTGGDTAPPTQPDPVKALVHFHRQLARRGIRLIVVPVPLKPMAHPAQLSQRYRGQSAGTDWLQNPSYPHFLREIKRAGITVFDVAAVLRGTPEAPFLRTDTHWTPDAMERAASALARQIKEADVLPHRPDTRYARRTTAQTNHGDIVAMLRLPAQQRLFLRQTVRLHPITGVTGAPWQPQRSADVLLLGDSFSNIYSLGAMGWGENAGFAEQISYHLQRPLDSITVNAGGSYATRQKLAQEMKRGHDRLRGKRLVIYEFAMRDLASGDWKLLDLPAVP